MRQRFLLVLYYSIFGVASKVDEAEIYRESSPADSEHSLFSFGGVLAWHEPEVCYLIPLIVWRGGAEPFLSIRKPVHTNYRP